MGAEENGDWVTIDEFARRAGLTVRNVRSHHSRGLLPPPQVRGRVGYYGPDHAARLRLVLEMQAEGFNLKSIQRMLDASGGASEEVLRFKRAFQEPLGAEVPEIIEAGELERRLRGPFDDKVVAKAEKMGLIRRIDDDRFEVPSPTLLRAGEQLIDLGVPIGHVLAVAEQVLRHTRAIAESFARMFVRDVMASVEADAPDSGARWTAASEAVERLRPLAGDAVMAAFHQEMAAAAERALSKQLGA